MTVTGVAPVAPEVSAPVRLAGQPNSEVLFNWLALKHHLWMLEDPGHLERFEELVGLWAGVRVLWRLSRWKGINGSGHPALRIPVDKVDVETAFTKLEKLLKSHFFGVEDRDARV